MNKRNNEKILEDLVLALELPPSAYERAVKRYEHLGEWLGREESECSKNSPHVFPQGSFRLGTAIKPLEENEEYDLDLACSLREGVTNYSHSQEELKSLIGRELSAYRQANNIKNDIEEKHRCWRLEYQDDMNFHMDIVPCIPKDEAEKQQLTASLESYDGLSKTLTHDVVNLAVGITDNTLGDYNYKNSSWMISNPEGYAKWFDSKNQLSLQLRATMEAAQVDEVPNNRNKTALQQVIQLLKRHRDSMFRDNSDSKPISVIITTLVASNYDGSSSLVETISNALSTLEQFAISSSNIVHNPVNPEENFADKWSKPEYQNLNLHQSFKIWVNQAKNDFELYLEGSDSSIITESINDAFYLNISEESISDALGNMIPKFEPASNIHTPHARPWARLKESL